MVEIKVSTRLEFNQKAIREILTAPAVRADMKRRADEIADAANASAKAAASRSSTSKPLRPDETDPYLATELVLERQRAAASVLTRTRRGKRDNLRHGTLLKNLDKGR